MPSSIGISSPTSHWYARLCISFLLKRHSEIALAVKDDSELADCIWNGVEEVSHRGTDFLSVRSAKERKEYFDHTFGGMCIKHFHYFQLTLNHFIRSVLSKFIWIPYCVFFDYICLLILFSLLVGVTETNFTDIINPILFFGLLLCTSLFTWTLVIVPPSTTGLSSYY